MDTSIYSIADKVIYDLEDNYILIILHKSTYYIKLQICNFLANIYISITTLLCKTTDVTVVTCVGLGTKIL